MAKKASENSKLGVAEKANKPLAKNLSKLIGKDVAKMAEHLGCSPQAINQYKMGTSVPQLEKLVKIAQYYNVSTDYLLGLSDVATTDPKIKEICEYTGLSEEAVIQLHKKTEDEKKYPFFDSFLEYINIFITDGLLAIYKNLDCYINSVRSCGYLEKKYSEDVLTEKFVLSVNTTNNKVSKPQYSNEELEAREIYQSEVSNTQPTNIYFLQKAFIEFVEQYGKEVENTITVENYENYAAIKNNSLDRYCNDLGESVKHFTDYIKNDEKIRKIAQMKEKDGANNG